MALVVILCLVPMLRPMGVCVCTSVQTFASADKNDITNFVVITLLLTICNLLILMENEFALLYM